MTNGDRDGSRVRSSHEFLSLLDEILDRKDETWWDAFFTDRTKAIPFFVDVPDETLVEDLDRGNVRPGRVLELGCGNGRNAIYLASRGCSVDAIDFSGTAIRWARERANRVARDIRFVLGSIFDVDFEPAAYDLVYDSGCFHHVPPHRRPAYLDLVARALRPDGILSVVCFTPDGGSGLSDGQVYERRTLGGGLGFSETDLRYVFARDFDLVAYRRMNETPLAADRFGKATLASARLVKRPHEIVPRDPKVRR